MPECTLAERRERELRGDTWNWKQMREMTAEDIAETIFWVATLPPHINVNRLELMPTSQSFAGFQVHRRD